MSPLGRLSLVNTMVHELPNGRFTSGSDSQIIYSNKPTPFNLSTDRFVREQMLVPALAESRKVIESPTSSVVVPALVKQILSDPAKLAPNSKLIAKHLHEKQAFGSPAGVFMASLAKEDESDRFIILKAEHQEGVKLKHTNTDGEIIFEVEHLTELIMGRNSRVYKIAMFGLNSETNQLFGFMVDKQNGDAYADYFLIDFLGCELTHRAELQTETFVKGLTRLANDGTFSPEKKARYATAGLAYLESNLKDIKTNVFISDFIDLDDQDRIADKYFSEVRNTEFPKDLRLVKSHIGGLRIKISNGVEINASKEAMTEGLVRFEAESDEGPRTVVKGTPTTFELSRPPK